MRIDTGTLIVLLSFWLAVSVAANMVMIDYVSRLVGYNFVSHYGLLQAVGIAAAAWIGAYTAVAIKT